MFLYGNIYFQTEEKKRKRDLEMGRCVNAENDSLQTGIPSLDQPGNDK